MERTKRDFRCQFAALLLDLRALSSTDVPVLLLNQPRVAFAKGFAVMTSLYFTVRALFTGWHFAFYLGIILVINKQIVPFLLFSYYLRKLYGGERALIR